MVIDRRDFVATVGSLAVVAATASAAQAKPAAATEAASQPSVIDAGAISAFTRDGVYDATRDQGCFVIRRNEELFALSSICTHRGCKVRAQLDESYVCKCHGSMFDRDGKVTKGPAKQDLPRLALAINADQHVEVDLTQKFARGHFQPRAAQ